MSTGTFPAIWYSSGSPQSSGFTHCDMARYYGYHAGPHGTGWHLKATALPLATGIGIHRGVALIGEWILDWQVAHPNQHLQGVAAGANTLPHEVIAWAATEAADQYAAKARAKGLLLTQTDATSAEAIDQLIGEQRTLIEGLTWVWALAHLPALLSQYRLFDVEHEEGIMLDCTCGLGEDFTDLAAHQARNCTGIYQMGKPDQLWQPIEQPQSLLYCEFKGWGSTNASKENKWQHSPQLLTNMEAASARTGLDVSAAQIVVLLKGWRGRDKGAAETEPKYQHSPICYGYFDAGNPPMREPNWAAQYKWFDPETGRGHTLPKTYDKVPVWLEQFGERPLPMPSIRPGASRVESWVRQFITDKQFGDVIRVLGPHPRPRGRRELAIKGLLAEERRWRGDVELLRQHNAVMPADPMVDDLIARSWECTSYDNSICQFARMCNREPGWEDPEASGRYERRRPHHAPEAAAVEALGVELPADEDELEAGDGE